MENGVEDQEIYLLERMTRALSQETRLQYFFWKTGYLIDTCTEQSTGVLHGLESNPGSSLQTEEEAGLP